MLQLLKYANGEFITAVDARQLRTMTAAMEYNNIEAALLPLLTGQ